MDIENKIINYNRKRIKIRNEEMEKIKQNLFLLKEQQKLIIKKMIDEEQFKNKMLKIFEDRKIMAIKN